MFREWMERWEPVWLAVAFLLSITFEGYTAWMVKREYDYDEQKDIEKKQKKTKTTKKTITQPGGASTTEEITETTEPIENKNV